MDKWNKFKSYYGFLYYLWGIETGVRKIVVTNITAFYITYEELKLTNGPQPRAITSTFYITYEELKLNHFLPMNAGGLAFYITYEELKPGPWLLLLALCVQLFILPMRNWNKANDKDNKCLHPFLYYLWGIETSFKGFNSFCLILFLYYLWGIETHERGHGWNIV